MSSESGLNAIPRAATCSWSALPPSMSTVRSTTGCHRRKLMASISLRKPIDSPRPSSSARAATSAWKNSSASTRASNKPADRRRTLTSQIEIKECRHDALTVTVAGMCSKLIADFGTLPGANTACSDRCFL